MSSQGPRKQSDAVYRRRRIAVGILAVLALLGVWWLVSTIIGLFTDDEEPEETASEQQAEEPADQDADAGSDEDTDDADGGEHDSEGGDGGSCAPGDVQITADTGDESYAPDEAPLLILEIQNTGSEDCTLDVGTAQQSFVVASGGREIFNTAQCGPGEGAQGEQAQDEGASLEMDFDPGQTERAHLTWPRSDSAADCTEPADLEPGTYELTVSLGGITSETHEFTLAEA